MALMTTPAYYRAGDLVPLLLLHYLIVASKYHLEFGILHSKQTKYYLYINAATQAIHVTAGFMLVRMFGIWGAAFAGVLSRALQSVLLHQVAKRFFEIPFNFVRNAQAVLAAAVGIGLARLLPGEFSIFSVLPKAMLAAATVAVILRVYGIRPLDIVRGALPQPTPSVGV
jgi:hypothetical protein